MLLVIVTAALFSLWVAFLHSFGWKEVMTSALEAGEIQALVRYGYFHREFTGD